MHLSGLEGVVECVNLSRGILGLVDLNPCLFLTRYPMIVAVARGQYLVALVSVSPGQEE